LSDGVAPEVVSILPPFGERELGPLEIVAEALRLSLAQEAAGIERVHDGDRPAALALLAVGLRLRLALFIPEVALQLPFERALKGALRAGVDLERVDPLVRGAKFELRCLCVGRSSSPAKLVRLKTGAAERDVRRLPELAQRCASTS
jgi:hypothetical protein